MIPFKKIYIGKEMELDQSELTPCLKDIWKEILLDESNTKSVMIFRKNKYGDISIETIMRDNGDIISHIGDDYIDESTVWHTVEIASQNGCDVYLTLDRHKYYQLWYNEE